MHVLRTECVDCDRRNERRVDPARESYDDIGETVLADIIPRPDNERPIDLCKVAENCRNCRFERTVCRPGRVSDVDDRRGRTRLRTGQFDRGKQQVFLELGGASQHVTPTVNEHASAVKDEFVLATHLVDVCNGAARRLRSLCNHRRSFVESTAMER